jgi:hypothetical protein
VTPPPPTDRIRELREALKRWDGNDYMPESQMRLIVDTARDREYLALRESLQDGSAYERAAGAWIDYMGFDHHDPSVWEKAVEDMKPVVNAALKVEGDAE